jgi:uncharacterized membrane protein YccC
VEVTVSDEYDGTDESFRRGTGNIMKLLPFPWIFATRKTARKLIEHIEVEERIIAAQSEEIWHLRSFRNSVRAAQQTLRQMTEADAKRRQERNDEVP